jgi:hypothetical protein
MPEIDKFIVEATSSEVAGRSKTLKKRGNTTYLSKKAVFDKNRKPTEKQEDLRENFSAATLYAQAALTNPESKKLYEKRANVSLSAFNVALRDYMKPPKVKKIITSSYTGNPASTIKVKAIDDFRVKAVKVTIHNAAGDLVEEGEATLDPLNKVIWNYAATQLIAILPGSKIKAVAEDIPGNTGELEITL